ncbi:MAG: Re/Si-specific NAD(P)(+) transhydrogenase subunit alpha [Bacteroidales bacterium]|nr:Re/Si-specific NAD(P)(+) transhydrogenase subunit alpha [Bacteroidales bacterium]
MNIGILRESGTEKRVIITPEVVKSLIDMKAGVYIEKGAGEKATISDKQYVNAGASIGTKSDVFDICKVILKINNLTEEELKALKKDQVVVASLNPFINIQTVKKLADEKVTSFSMELVPRITRAQSMDILSSMATVAGYKAVLDAAMHLPKFFPMFMSAAGTIKPAKILILGAGVAGLQAIAIARKLGAVVEVFDVRSAVKDEVKSLGGKFIEVEGAVEDKNAGGYAVEQTEEFKERQAKLIHDHTIKSDVVICTAQIPGKRAPVLIKKETVEGMRSGSVIVDLAASTGGNCEITKDGETILYHEITIIGKSDYPSDMPYDSSLMFARNVLNFLKLIIDEEGNLNLDFEDEIIRNTCLTYNGEIIIDKVKSTM